MAGGTTLQVRNYQLTFSVGTLGASSDSFPLLGMVCPATGSEVVELGGTVETAGTVTTSATTTFQLVDSSNVSLTAVQAAFNNAAAAGTEVITVAGNGNSAGNAGVRLRYLGTMAGTINAGSTILFRTIWAF